METESQYKNLIKRLDFLIDSTFKQTIKKEQHSTFNSLSLLYIVKDTLDDKIAKELKEKISSVLVDYQLVLPTLFSFRMSVCKKKRGRKKYLCYIYVWHRTPERLYISIELYKGTYTEDDLRYILEIL